MDPAFEYVFPAIKGVQAKREYYVSMCPLKLIPKIFHYDEEDLVPPELRAQRILNKTRVPEISRYIVENKNDYVYRTFWKADFMNSFFQTVLQT